MRDLLSNLAARWLPALADAAIRSTVLLAAAAVVATLMRRASSSARLVVWQAALIGCLALPAMQLSLPAWRVLPRWAAPVEIHQTARAEILPSELPAPVAAEVEEPFRPIRPEEMRNAEQRSSTDARRAAEQPRPAEEQAAAGECETAKPVASVAAAADVQTDARADRGSGAWSWAQVLAAAWVGGAVACLAWPVVGFVALWRLSRRGRPLTGDEWEPMLDRTMRTLGLRRRVALLEVDRAIVPMVWGVFRTRLALPVSARTWSHERRSVVLLHELGHVRRYDCLLQLLMRATCAVYWFHPLAWWTARRVQAEAEKACDDIVLAAGSRPVSYARHLVELVAGLPARAPSPGAAMARSSKLESRVRSILDRARPRRQVSRRRAFCTAVAVLIAAGAVAALGPAVLLPTARAQSDLVTEQPAEPLCMLEFRVVPQTAVSGEFVYVPKTLQELYGAILAHRGPEALVRQNTPYRWLPVTDGITEVECGGLLAASRGEKRYLLVCHQDRHVMIPGRSGRWGMKWAYAMRDEAGYPAVGFELDARGSELVGRFAGRYAGHRIAVIIDGRIVGLDEARTWATGTGVIRGRFTPDQAGQLAQKLMSPAAAAPKARPGAGAVGNLSAVNGPQLDVQATEVFTDDFEQLTRPQWSASKTDRRGGRTILGRFGREAVRLRLADMPGHRMLRVSLDLWLFHGWAGRGIGGSQGPDVWQAEVADGPRLVAASFSNLGPDPAGHDPGRQSFPDNVGVDLFSSRTGAVEANALKDPADPRDTRYRLVFVFPHDDPRIELVFAATRLGGPGRQWALDNVRVETIAEMPEPPQGEAMDKLWQELGDGDPVVSYRAKWALIAGGPATVDFLTRQLLPPDRAMSKDARRIVADLSREDWSASASRLARQLTVLLPADRLQIRRLAQQGESVELRKRLDIIWYAAGRRATEQTDRLSRAAHVIEVLHPQRAKEMLWAISLGSPWATSRQEAAHCLARLNLPLPPGELTQADEAALARLRAGRLERGFEGISLREAIGRIERAAGVNVGVSYQGLHRAGAGMATPVSDSFVGLSADEVLGRLCRSIGGGLKWTVRDGAVCIE